MGIMEHHRLKGRLVLVMQDREGNLKGEQRISNLITHAGRNLLAGYLTGRIEGPPRLSVAVGLGKNPPAETDTALKDPVDEVPVDEEKITIGRKENEVRAVLTATLPPAEAGEKGQSLREAGIVAAFSDGSQVLYNRTVFPVITRTDNLRLTLSWELFF